MSNKNVILIIILLVKMTRAEENYLKTIFHLGGHSGKTVSTNALAQEMETQPSSVTDMLKKLGDKKMVKYIKYKGATLTRKGNTSALNIIRKHRLWEVFLVNTLEFNWDEVHEVAEQLEHIKSEKLIDELDKLLGYPKYDPHGDPIPKKDGTFPRREKLLLSEIPIGKSGVCIGVKDSSSSFLQYLDKNQIALGDTITVVEREDFDQSLKIEIGEKKLQLSHQIANNLYLKSN